MNTTAPALAVSRCRTTGKLSFTSRPKARKASRLHPDHMSEYRCDACGYWHIGHVAPDIIRGVVSRGDVYGAARHAHSDDQTPEMDTLEQLQAARQMLVTGRRRIRGVDRDAAVARLDAEISRVAATVGV